MPHGHLVPNPPSAYFRPCHNHSTCRAVNISTSRTSHCTAEPLIGRQDTHAKFKQKISGAGLSNRCPGVPHGEYGRTDRNLSGRCRHMPAHCNWTSLKVRKQRRPGNVCAYPDPTRAFARDSCARETGRTRSAADHAVGETLEANRGIGES